MKLKPIERDAIPRALAKAERYRLLREPREAESICRDVLAIDPQNAEARVCLILALTDMFEGLEFAAADVRGLVEQLPGEFERHYYAGVVDERWAKALLVAGYGRSEVYGLLASAMREYEAAERIAPATNDDATLRWNACVRMIERCGLGPEDGGGVSELDLEDEFGDDVPVR